MSRIEEWFKNAVGRGMNPDNAYGYQCKDVADDYCIHLFGNWQNTIRPANAKDAYGRASDEFFIKIPNNLNDKYLIPQRGDIIVWGASQANPYGHIAVVESADTSGANVIEQDGFKNTVPAYRAKRGYIYLGMPCIGWLRPRPEKIIGYQPAVAGNERVLAVKAHARNEANIKAGIFQTINAGLKVAMKGYVTNGEAVNGDTVWFVTARSGKYMSRQVFQDKGLHDLADLTPKAEPQPEPVPVVPEPTPEIQQPEPEAEIIEPETPENTEKPTYGDTPETAPEAPEPTENQKTDNNSSDEQKTPEKMKEKEQTMQHNKKSIAELGKTTAEAKNLLADVADSDEVKKLVGGISSKVKLAVYIVGDTLIGAGLVLPSLAVAFNFGTLNQIQALSSACATAGAFVLTMFGIYQSGKEQ